MFDRFTEPTRRVIVLAEEECRLAGHADLGTDHILLGLIGEGESIAAKVLTEDNGLELPNARDHVSRHRHYRGHPGPSASPAFTPTVKVLLEKSLREALQLGYNTIAPEHILLAMTSEDIHSLAAVVLRSQGIDPAALRLQVIKRLSAPPPAPKELLSDKLLAAAQGVKAVRVHILSVMEKTVSDSVDRALKEMDLAIGAQLLRERRARSL